VSQAAPAQMPPAPGSRTPPRTVADLAEVCSMSPQAPEYTAATYFCRGFLAGVGQYHSALHPVGGAIPPVFCAPDPPPRLADVAAAFVAWTRANPQHGTEMAVDGLARFARQTYPCPPQPAQGTGRRGR
jgi:Rap1a immunity proteins